MALLRLLRFSLAPTLVADIAAGMAWAAADPLATPQLLVFGLLCNLPLFVGGMALNAYVDREEDARTRPHRPIPSGAVAPRTAITLAVLGLLGGPLMAFLVDPSRVTFGWTALLAVLIALYHGPWKRRGTLLLGPCLLAGIRAGSLGIGLVLVRGTSGLPEGGPGALLYGLYVLGASLVAAEEDRQPRRAWVATGVLASSLVLLVCVVLAFRRADFVPAAISGLVVLYWWAAVGPLCRRAHLGLGPATVGPLAGGLLGRMPLCAAALALAVGSMPAALVALAAFVCVRWLVRWIPPT